MLMQGFHTEFLNSLEFSMSRISAITGYFSHSLFDSLESPSIFVKTCNAMYIEKMYEQ